FAGGTTCITEPRLSRDHTERLFQFFKIAFRREGTTLLIDGRPSVGWNAVPRLVVPGDLSAAAFFIVGATIVPGSDVTIQQVGINPTRAGLLDVMARMGAEIQLFNRLAEEGEPVAEI